MKISTPFLIVAFVGIAITTLNQLNLLEIEISRDAIFISICIFLSAHGITATIENNKDDHVQ